MNQQEVPSAAAPATPSKEELQRLMAQASQAAQAAYGVGLGQLQRKLQDDILQFIAEHPDCQALVFMGQIQTPVGTATLDLTPPGEAMKNGPQIALPHGKKKRP